MTPPNFSEIIPSQLLENPVPLHVHRIAFQELVKVCVPATTIGILAFVAAVLSSDNHLGGAVVGLFILLGISMLFLDVYGVFVYEDDKQDVQWRRDTYGRHLTIVTMAINHLTIIQKATTVNLGQPMPVSTPKTQFLVPEVDIDLNLTYDVARVMIEQAAQGYKANHGKRPKLKPISFDAVVKQIEAGHPRWQDACNLLSEAQIVSNPMGSNWELLIQDQEQCYQLLDVLMMSKGYYRVMKNGKGEWRVGVPQ